MRQLWDCIGTRRGRTAATRGCMWGRSATLDPISHPRHMTRSHRVAITHRRDPHCDPSIATFAESPHFHCPVHLVLLAYRPHSLSYTPRRARIQATFQYALPSSVHCRVQIMHDLAASCAPDGATRHAFLRHCSTDNAADRPARDTLSLSPQGGTRAGEPSSPGHAPCPKGEGVVSEGGPAEAAYEGGWYDGGSGAWAAGGGGAPGHSGTDRQGVAEDAVHGWAPGAASGPPSTSASGVGSHSNG